MKTGGFPSLQDARSLHADIRPQMPQKHAKDAPKTWAGYVAKKNGVSVKDVEAKLGRARESKRARLRLDLLDQCVSSGFSAGASAFVSLTLDALSRYAEQKVTARSAGVDRAILDVGKCARRAFALGNRKTHRNQDVKRAIDKLRASIESLAATDPLYGLSLLAFGISAQLVRWSTGQSPLACLMCQEQPSRRPTCDCSRWPDGCPLEFTNDAEHWIDTPVTAKALDPASYADVPRRGLLELLSARLSPAAPCLRKPRGRPQLDKDAELMHSLFQACEDAFRMPVNRKNYRLLALLQSVLDRLQLDHIELEYRMKRHERSRVHSGNELLATIVGWSWAPPF